MRHLINRLPKWASFALAGLLGGSGFSLLAETWISRASEPPVVSETIDARPVDLVFVLDVSGSMSEEIGGVRRNLTQFLRHLSERGLSGRFALVIFDDGARVVMNFTESVEQVIAAIEPLRASGGRAGGDSSLAGLYVASSLNFKQGSRRVLILVTDEDYNLPDPPVSSLSDVTSALRKCSIDQLHLVVSSGLKQNYAFLRDVAPGMYFSLDSSGRSAAGLDTLFSNVAQAVANPSMLSTSTGSSISAKFSWEAALQVALWGGLACFGVGLLIAIVQQFSLGQTLSAAGLSKVGAVGLGLGCVSGLMAQTIYGLSLHADVNLGEVPRVFAWCMMGGGMGLSLSLVIPNLPKVRSLAYGAAAGLASAILFLIIGRLGSDVVARFLGAGGLGVGIALAVSLAEVLARRAHIIIHWAPNETSTVSLGSKSVDIGTGKEATVRLPGSTNYPAKVASFSLEEGRAVLVNHMSNTRHVLRDGNKLNLGRIVIEVKITLLGSPRENR